MDCRSVDYKSNRTGWTKEQGNPGNYFTVKVKSSKGKPPDIIPALYTHGSICKVTYKSVRTLERCLS